jgi:hypothetical protein
VHTDELGLARYLIIFNNVNGVRALSYTHLILAEFHLLIIIAPILYSRR